MFGGSNSKPQPKSGPTTTAGGIKTQTAATSLSTTTFLPAPHPNSSYSDQTTLTSSSDESDGESIFIAVAADTLTSSMNIEKSIAFIRALVLEIKADCEILIGDKNLSMTQNLEKLNEANIKYVKAKLSLVYVRSNDNDNEGEFKHEIQILTRDFVQVAKVYLEIYKEFKGLISDLNEESYGTATTYWRDDSTVQAQKSTPRRRHLSRDSSSTSNDSDENKTVSCSGAATPPTPRNFRSRSNSEASSVDIESGKKDEKKKLQKKPSKIKRAFTYVMGVFGFGGNGNLTSEDDSARSKSTLAYYADDGNFSGADKIYDDHSQATVINAYLDQYNNASDRLISLKSGDGRNKLWKTHSSIELNKNNLFVDTCDAKSQSAFGGAPKVQTFFDFTHPVSNSPFVGKINHCEVHHDSSDPTIIPAEPDELY